MTLDALCIILSSQIFLCVNVIREAFKCSHSLARSQPNPLNQIFGDNNLFFSNTIDEDSSTSGLLTAVVPYVLSVLTVAMLFSEGEETLALT